MNYKKNLIFSLIFISVTSFFFYGCGEVSSLIQGDDNPPQYAFYPTNYSVTPFETVILTIEEYYFAENEYWGSIYGKDIQLIKVKDNQLTFMMPFIPEGERIFEMVIEGATHDIVFNINPLEEIDNPEEVILQYKENVVTAFDELKGMNDKYNLQLDPDNLKIIENYISDFNQSYSSATTEEKQELAQFMKANPGLFEFNHFDYSIFNDSLNANRDFVNWDQKLQSDMNYFVGLVIATGATIGIFNGALVSLNPIAVSISGAALLTEVFLLKSHVKMMLNRTYKPFEFDITGELRSNTVEFENNITYQLGIDADYRTLYKNDESISDVTIELVSNINTVTHYWNQILENIPGTSGSIENLKDKDGYQVNAYSWAVTSEYITIENISNSNVMLSAFSNTGKVDVTFSTYLEEDIDFTFDIVYNNPAFGKDIQTISGRILADPCSDDNDTPIIENYTNTYTNGVYERVFEFPFSDEGTGIMYSGSYFGACDPYNDNCYPVIVEFKQWSLPGSEWALAANSYDVELISGDKNSGVLRITFDYFVDHEYKITVRDFCGHYSSPVIFSNP